MLNPKISICIPTYNGADYLQEALDSISIQSFRDFEVIISDDASSDNTLKMVQAFKEHSRFPVYIFHHTPHGIGANWNNCLKHIKGKYIKFLFQDDVMEKECLHKMVKVMETNTNIGLVASKRSFIIEDNVNNNVTKEWFDKYGDLQKGYSPSDGVFILTKDIFKSEIFMTDPKNKIGEPSTVLFRKSILDEVGYFNEELKQILDYEYWYRILKKHPIAIINEPLIKFRLHQNQVTNVNRNQDINDYKLYEQILYKHYFKLLHPKIRKHLYLKYHPFPQFKKRVLKKIKRMLT